MQGLVLTPAWLGVHVLHGEGQPRSCRLNAAHGANRWVTDRSVERVGGAEVLLTVVDSYHLVAKRQFPAVGSQHGCQEIASRSVACSQDKAEARRSKFDPLTEPHWVGGTSICHQVISQSRRAMGWGTTLEGCAHQIVEPSSCTHWQELPTLAAHIQVAGHSEYHLLSFRGWLSVQARKERPDACM